MIIIYIASGLLLCLSVVLALPPPYQVFVVGPVGNGGVGLNAFRSLCTTAAEFEYGLGYPSVAWPLVAGSPELDAWDQTRNVTTPSGTKIASAADFKAGTVQSTLSDFDTGCSNSIWTGLLPGFVAGVSCSEWTNSSFSQRGLLGSCFASSWLPSSPNPIPCSSNTYMILCVYVEPTPSPSPAPTFLPTASPITSSPSASPVTSHPSLSPITSSPTKSPTRETPSPVEDSVDDGSGASEAEFNIQEYAVPIGVGAGGLAVALGLVGVYFVVRKKQKRLALRQSLANAGK